MLTRIQSENLGPLSSLDWKNLSKINLIIGENGSGKTFLLKAIYASLKAVERNRRGNENQNLNEILSRNIYWTFQVDKFRELVRKGAKEPLSFSIFSNRKQFSFTFGKDTSHQINNVHNTMGRRDSNSIFLPAKEVLSLHQVILKSREENLDFGFDDTYLDLARALRPTTMGKNFRQFSDARSQLSKILGGTITYDKNQGNWVFVKDKYKFPISVTAEGIKKISILDTLLGNRYLNQQSVIIIDEPESALHPVAISKLMEIIALLADCGLQFFIASHSYFIIKKLFNISQRNKWSIPTLSLINNSCVYENLHDGLPDNPIIAESIRLYEEEIGLAF